MRKYRVVLAEDEKIVLKELNSYFEDLNDFEVVGCFYDSEKAYDWIGENEDAFDVLITDIEMQGNADGITLAQKAKKATIFISGKISTHVEQIEDIHLDSEMSVSFLTKPATLDKLSKALDKLKSKGLMDDFAFFKIKKEGQRGFKEKLFFKDIKLIVTAISGRNNKECYLEGRKITLLDYTHEQLVEILPKYFQAVGKGRFICRDAIKAIDNSGIILTDQLAEQYGFKVIEISKDYKASFEKFMNNY